MEENKENKMGMLPLVLVAIEKGMRCPVCKDAFIYTCKGKPPIYECWKCKCGSFIKHADGDLIYHKRGMENICNGCGKNREMGIFPRLAKIMVCGCRVVIKPENGEALTLRAEDAPNTIEAFNFLKGVILELTVNAKP